MVNEKTSISLQELERFAEGPLYKAIRRSFAEERRIMLTALQEWTTVSRKSQDQESLNNAIKESVLQALENPKYKWRTIQGIVNEVGLDQAKVREILDQCNDEVVHASKLSKDGRELFTTRSHFQATATLLDKLFGAFKMRLD